MTISTELPRQMGLLVEEPRYLLSILRRCRSDLDSGLHLTVAVHCKVLHIGQHDSEPAACCKRCLGIGSRDSLAIQSPASLRLPASRASRVAIGILEGGLGAGGSCGSFTLRTGSPGVGYA